MPTTALIPRRRLLQGAGAMVTLRLAALPPAAAALPDPLPDPLAALTAKTVDEALSALGAPWVPSPQVTLDVPASVDNGAFVPVTVACALAGAREILLLVDSNPQALAAHFIIPAGTEPFVATRIRMAASGTVYAAVRTHEGVFGAMRSVQVAVGGCT